MTATDRFELSLTRLIDAPRELVFEAWTKHLPEWFGPHGMTVPVCEMDLRAGGFFNVVMRAPDGTEYPCPGLFLEVVENERIVSTDAFRPGWIPSGRAFMVLFATFEDEQGKTRYTTGARHWSAADLEAHEKMGFHDGWGQTADRLEAVVAKLKG